jgi:hypothetical protein
MSGNITQRKNKCSIRHMLYEQSTLKCKSKKLLCMRKMHVGAWCVNNYCIYLFRGFEKFPVPKNSVKQQMSSSVFFYLIMFKYILSSIGHHPFHTTSSFIIGKWSRGKNPTMILYYLVYL